MFTRQASLPWETPSCFGNRCLDVKACVVFQFLSAHLELELELFEVDDIGDDDGDDDDDDDDDLLHH